METLEREGCINVAWPWIHTQFVDFAPKKHKQAKILDDSDRARIKAKFVKALLKNVSLICRLGLGVDEYIEISQSKKITKGFEHFLTMVKTGNYEGMVKSYEKIHLYHTDTFG